MTQLELAERAGVSESTIQNLEAGRQYTRRPPSLSRVEAALGWAPGSADIVLDGGEPVEHVDRAVEPSTPEEAVTAPSGQPILKTGMPLRIVQELTMGQVMDADVLDLSRPGSDARMVVVLVRGQSDASPDEIREDFEEWSRVQRELRRMTKPAADEPDDRS